MRLPDHAPVSHPKSMRTNRYGEHVASLCPITTKHDLFRSRQSHRSPVRAPDVMTHLTLPTISSPQIHIASLLEAEEHRRFASSTIEPTKELCAVCADSASGYHYGVLTCLGCKTFFRRTVAKGQNFHCRFNNSCRIDKDIRCVCRCCRFRKCLEVGMDASGVQRKQTALVEPTSSKSSSPPTKIDRAQTIIDRLIDWEQTHIERRKAIYRTSSRELTLRGFLEENPQQEEDEDARTTPSPTPDAPIQMRLAHTSDVNLVCRVDRMFLLEWAEFQEDFGLLADSDKMVLLNSFMMQYLILEHAYYTVTQGYKDIWVFPNDTYLPRKLTDLPAELYEKLSERRRQFQDKLFSPLYTRFIDEVAGPLYEIQLSMAERCALKALLFWNPGNTALSPEAKTIVEKVNCNLLSALYMYYAENATPNHAIRYGNVLLLAPAIVSTGLQCAEDYQLSRFFDLSTCDRLLDEFHFK